MTLVILLPLALAAAADRQIPAAPLQAVERADQGDWSGGAWRATRNESPPTMSPSLDGMAYDPKVHGELPKKPEEAVETKLEPMTLADAKANFPDVIDRYIAERSRRGAWPLEEKPSGRILELTLQGVDAATIREVKPGYFTGTAVLIEAKTALPRRVDFLVDLSGTMWSVQSASLLPPAPRRALTKKRRPS